MYQCSGSSHLRSSPPLWVGLWPSAALEWPRDSPSPTCWCSASLPLLSRASCAPCALPPPSDEELRSSSSPEGSGEGSGRTHHTKNRIHHWNERQIGMKLYLMCVWSDSWGVRTVLSSCRSCWLRLEDSCSLASRAAIFSSLISSEDFNVDSSFDSRSLNLKDTTERFPVFFTVREKKLRHNYVFFRLRPLFPCTYWRCVVTRIAVSRIYRLLKRNYVTLWDVSDERASIVINTDRRERLKPRTRSSLIGWRTVMSEYVIFLIRWRRSASLTPRSRWSVFDGYRNCEPARVVRRKHRESRAV